MDKVFVAKRVAQRLWAAEDAVDAAIAEASALMGGLVEARRELGVSSTFGDEAASKVAETIAALAEARRAMVASHHALADCKLRIGVRTKMEGGLKPIQVQETETQERQAV